MKGWIAVVLLGWVALGLRSSAAETELRASKPEVRKEVVAVIDAQLTAFRQNDPAAAYAYSAERLKAQRSLRSFSAIVKAGYPEIWSNTGAGYGIVRDDGEQATVLVHVTGKDGEASYDYRLVKERTGWRIAGVLPHEARPGERL